MREGAITKYKLERNPKFSMIFWYTAIIFRNIKTNLEKVSAIELPESPNYVSISSFLKENKKLGKKI